MTGLKRSSRSVKIADGLYKAIPFVIVAIFLNLIIGMTGSWISTIAPAPQFLKVLYSTMQHNVILSIFVSVLIMIILGLLWPLAKTVRRSDVVLSEKEVKHLYLDWIIKETREHQLKQLFPGFAKSHLPRAKLEQIFYHLNFIYSHSTEQLIDRPFSKREIDDIINDPHLSPLEKENMKYEWESSYGIKQATVSIAGLWTSLTNDSPAAVILGCPGSGKSTLLQAFAFYMAERYQKLTLFSIFSDSYNQMLHPDPQSIKQPLLPVKSPLIPVKVSLGDFANERANDSNLTLTDYILERQFAQGNFEGVRRILEIYLRRGHCLVLFDGLNAIIADREAVKKEIKTFIKNNNRNRFIITSRIAGYDGTCFNDYDHYKIEELTASQIKQNIDIWYKLVVSDELTTIENEVEKQRIGEEIKTKLAPLRQIIEDLEANKQLSEADQQIYELAKQPLLLTLLIWVAVTTDKPIFTKLQRRIQLYKMVIPMLLQNYKNAQGQPALSEETVVLHVGQLAFKMVEEGKRWLNSGEIRQILQSDQAGIDAILEQIREGSSIFVKRAEDRFGFSQRTYQEYFAARYLLWKIAIARDDQSQTSAIEELIHLAYQVHPDDVWIEPFILAVAFQSYEKDSEIANKIIQKLLEISSGEQIDNQVHSVCLAVSAQMEINPASIKELVISETAETLLASYEEAFNQQRFDLCEQIAMMIRTWLNHLEYSPVCTQLLRTALYKLAAITLLPIFIKGSAECLEKLYQLQIAAQTGSLTVASLEACAHTICGNLVEENNGQTTLAFELLHCSLASAADEVGLRVVLQMMAETESEQIRRHCANALKDAHPSVAEAQKILELWKQFSGVT